MHNSSELYKMMLAAQVSGVTTTTTTTSQKQTQTEEEDIYDLDDPYLIPRFLSQKKRPKVPMGTITCRFLAIPVNRIDAFSNDIAQYGQIMHESRHKLIILVAQTHLAFVDDIRRAWVSKYLTPFTECVMSFDLPKYHDKTTTVIIEQVPTTTTNESADTSSISGGGGNAMGELSAVPNEAAAAVGDSRVLVRFSRPMTGGERGDAAPFRILRVRNLLPKELKRIFCELDYC
ncbi:hypothetical protein F5Y08DRAFT_300689 [Xylaria arbuscula]|nr:hypothetical protein F5Y08DRAFT_300689 [Xylaria arbuscula]